jgi:hypothetical protein
MPFQEDHPAFEGDHENPSKKAHRMDFFRETPTPYKDATYAIDPFEGAKKPNVCSLAQKKERRIGSPAITGKLGNTSRVAVPRESLGSSSGPPFRSQDPVKVCHEIVLGCAQIGHPHPEQ